MELLQTYSVGEWLPAALFRFDPPSHIYVIRRDCAGPAGLVAALTLLQNGIPVRIIEKDPNPRIGQRGPGIWPRSIELFNFLSVPEVNDLAKPFPVIRSYKPGTLECAAEFPMVPHMESTPAIPFHAAKLMGQQLLDVILRRHLEKFSCSVEMGTELRSIEQSDDGVTAVLAKNGILETFDTKWVIGADGAKGVVRKQLGLTFLGETRDDFRMVMGDIRLKGVGLDRAYWHRFGNFKRGISLRPTDEIGEDGWQFIILGNDLDLTKVAQSEELIFEIIASVIPTDITFNKLVWVSEYRANIRMVNKLSEGRGFVVGDAAHVHSPTGGQGLNSSVQDAFNLGWKLALVEKGLADKSLLETYNTERLPVISEMLEMTTAILNQTLETDNAPVTRSPILFMLGINCRFSNIVLDEFAVPGKPINAYGVGGGESGVKTLFGLYRPWYHTVLVFAPSHADATPDLGENHAYSAYLVEAGQTKVFVVRPDGVVGAIVHGAEGVKKYFSGIFLNLSNGVEVKAVLIGERASNLDQRSRMFFGTSPRAVGTPICGVEGCHRSHSIPELDFRRVPREQSPVSNQRIHLFAQCLESGCRDWERLVMVYALMWSPDRV
ncbi:FAD binding domain-containing protein [Suillus subalutaceus]|uniref:FAD binding domain-containing protein n=1 Tax=Suillus subalutaceus TaxID=48586 RepID=UPI001B86707E|nr:FAD binding domain-containing protein [Suillus subalutaceus]KAG1829222.1 FAD binding domain-containing protein [Suillus subalutaceus]